MRVIAATILMLAGMTGCGLGAIATAGPWQGTDGQWMGEKLSYGGGVVVLVAVVLVLREWITSDKKDKQDQRDKASPS